MTGAHAKAVQTVMRHSAITLTMDTYGHLFPGQEADTVARLPITLGDRREALWATGTYGAEAVPHGTEKSRSTWRSRCGAKPSRTMRRVRVGKRRLRRR
jgi:hypothetical protein